MARLVATVGTNIGDLRIEAGEDIPDGTLTERQERRFVEDGYAVPAEKGQRIPAEVREAAAAGAGDPNPVAREIEVTDNATR